MFNSFSSILRPNQDVCSFCRSYAFLYMRANHELRNNLPSVRPLPDCGENLICCPTARVLISLRFAFCLPAREEYCSAVGCSCDRIECIRSQPERMWELCKGSSRVPVRPAIYDKVVWWSLFSVQTGFKLWEKSVYLKLNCTELFSRHLYPENLCKGSQNEFNWTNSPR